MPGHAPRRLPLRRLCPVVGRWRSRDAATIEARALQDSAQRRIWSTALDRRDWTSYVYVPLLVPILVLLPYLVVKSHQRSQRISHLVESLSQGSRDLGQMSRLLEGRQEPWIGEPAEEVHSFDESDFKGFGILQDSRIFDLRSWKPAKPAESDRSSLVFGYRRLKVFKQPEKGGDNLFHVYLLGSSPAMAVRFPTQQLQPKLSMCRVEDADPRSRKNITGARAMISSTCRPGSSSISSSNTTLLDNSCNVAAMGPR